MQEIASITTFLFFYVEKNLSPSFILVLLLLETFFSCICILDGCLSCGNLNVLLLFVLFKVHVIYRFIGCWYSNAIDYTWWFMLLNFRQGLILLHYSSLISYCSKLLSVSLQMLCFVETDFFYWYISLCKVN